MTESMARLGDRLHVDWYLFVPAILLSLAGLVTMNFFTGENYFFFRQSIWLLISVIVFFMAAIVDWRFLRRTKVLVFIFGVTFLALLILLLAGEMTRGAQSWFQFGAFAFQPSDPAKLVIILMLSKYFSRRHIEIKHIRHILVSGMYAFILFILVFLQPDFGGSMVILGIWFGMVLVSGISKKHLSFVIILGILTLVILWTSVFAPYQKARIVSFIHPLADFIFAAFAEEWGFVGTMILFALYLFLLIRITNNAESAATNFETFFGLGIVILFFVHIAIHAGMNMGVLPVTGITFPFMSYGGSHLVTEWFALGVLSSMKRHSQGPRL